MSKPRPPIDTDKPSPARIYDYLLGGTANYAVDREMAGVVLKVSPESKQVAEINRRFLREAVRYACHQGIDQFLDIGSGLPTQQNVHEVAQAALPGARTVYVDNDPRTLVEAEALIVDDPNTGFIYGDVTVPMEIISDPTTQRLIDFTKPVGVLLVAVMHFVPDADDPIGIVKTFMEQVPPDSVLIFSHATTDNIDPVVWKTVQANNVNLAVPLHFRPGEQIARFFDGLDLVGPGLVDTEQWMPDEALPMQPIPLKIRCGVGHKP